MKTSKFNIVKISTLLLAVMFFVSCGNRQAKEAENSSVTPKEEAFKSVTKYPIPTAFEVIKLLNNAGATYILSISNPIENVDKYIPAKSKALNLGVYGADLSYASTYQMKQETMNYLKVSKKLIDELQITSAFNVEFAQRVEKNIDNKDSLIRIISDSFYDTYEFLVNNGKDNTSLLVMAGSWIEGLYITTQMAIISKNNEDILKIVANQKEPLTKLLSLLEPYKTDKDVAEIAEVLKPLADIYNTIGIDKLTPEQFEQINKAVAQVRGTIVQ
ncbi:MAG: hypothetical protein EHM93_03220 [Bacteroidales bacterium]|nr:MAG: hypothetical protein EHM93_03220 [Bacteroidales bacterium]